MGTVIVARKTLSAPEKTLQSGVSSDRQGLYPSQAAQYKAALVDLGAVFLARGEMGIVEAITKVIEKRG